MALASTITLYGAGQTAVNGTYTLQPYPDVNGYLFYQKSSPTVYLSFAYGGTEWVLEGVKSNSAYVGSGSYYNGPSGDTATSISVNWSSINYNTASPPPPSFVQNPPTAPTSAPTYNTPGTSSVTLNNVPALSPAATAPVSITVTGAGTSSANGTYTNAGNDSNGNYYFSKGGTNFCYWQTGSNKWALSVTLGGTPLYTQSGTQTLATGPAGNYNVSLGGNSPAPTVTSVSGANAATSLNVQRATDSGFTTALTTFTGVTPSTNYTDATVAAGTTYYYRYGEVNSAGVTYGPGSAVTTASIFVPKLMSVSQVY